MPCQSWPSAQAAGPLGGGGGRGGGCRACGCAQGPGNITTYFVKSRRDDFASGNCRVKEQEREWKHWALHLTTKDRPKAVETFSPWPAFQWNTSIHSVGSSCLIKEAEFCSKCRSSLRTAGINLLKCKWYWAHKSFLRPVICLAYFQHNSIHSRKCSSPYLLAT